MHYGEVAMGGVTFASHSDLPTLPLILSASKYFRLIFQLSLSFYPCPNIPDTFVGDEMNSCQSCSALFHKRGTHFILKTNTTHRKWKWTEKSDIWPPCSIQKRAEIFAKYFFQTLDAIFSYKGVFFINVQKTNIIAFIKTNFLTPILSVKNTPFRFFVFFPSLHINFVIFFSFPIFWGVKKASCQIFHVLDENWPRNNFPKLTTLWLLLHANVTNFPIVHWLIVSLTNCIID